ncbi:MAG TPA: hypothetical protein VF884_16140 [Nitrososphaeraceae archaeon]
MQVLGLETKLEEYLLDMKRDINASENYTELTRRAIKKLGIVDYKSLTRFDIIKILDTLRKSEESDPLHKWIGTYNLYIVILKRFFKWMVIPNVWKI